LLQDYSNSLVMLEGVIKNGHTRKTFSFRVASLCQKLTRQLNIFRHFSLGNITILIGWSESIGMNFTTFHYTFGEQLTIYRIRQSLADTNIIERRSFSVECVEISGI